MTSNGEFVPIDAWLAVRDACACKPFRAHECRDYAASSNLMSARPHGSDSMVILTSGCVPEGRVAHGKVRPALPNPTGLRLWRGQDSPTADRGPAGIIERPAKVIAPRPVIEDPVNMLRALGRVPDVVRFASTVGNLGNIE